MNTFQQNLAEAIDIADTTPNSMIGFFANWEAVKHELNSYESLVGSVNFSRREYTTEFGGVVKFIQTVCRERIAGLNFSHVFIEMHVTATEYAYIQSRVRHPKEMCK